MQVNFACFFHLLIILKIDFLKKKFRKTMRVSNGLDPDKDRRSVSSDLGTNRLQG